MFREKDCASRMLAIVVYSIFSGAKSPRKSFPPSTSLQVHRHAPLSLSRALSLFLNSPRAARILINSEIMRNRPLINPAVLYTRTGKHLRPTPTKHTHTHPPIPNGRLVECIQSEPPWKNAYIYSPRRSFSLTAAAHRTHTGLIKGCARGWEVDRQRERERDASRGGTTFLSNAMNIAGCQRQAGRQRRRRRHRHHRYSRSRRSILSLSLSFSLAR